MNRNDYNRGYDDRGHDRNNRTGYGERNSGSYRSGYGQTGGRSESSYRSGYGQTGGRSDSSYRSGYGQTGGRSESSYRSGYGQTGGRSDGSYRSGYGQTGGRSSGSYRSGYGQTGGRSDGSYRSGYGQTGGGRSSGSYRSVNRINTQGRKGSREVNYHSDYDYDSVYGDDYDEEAAGRKKGGTGAFYLLMGVCFVVVILSVMICKKNFDKSGIVDEYEAAYLSSEEASSEPEPIDPAVQAIEETLQSMTTEQKVGQLFLVRNNGSGKFAETVSRTSAGGAVLFAKDFKGKTADGVRNLISELQAGSDGRMIIAVDEEGGDVVRISSNTRLRKSKFLSPQQLFSKGGFDLIKSDTEEKCDLLTSLGLNMNMAPVADVCTSSSGFMYSRSFGKGAEETAEYVSLVVSTMKEKNVASCVKHFPGYGNSKADTHKGLDVNKKTVDELKSSDLVPFTAAVDHDADGIMLTHTIIQDIDPDHPASLSPDVVAMIREDMGFDGLIITDGLDMGAIIDYSQGDSGKVCVMAVLAGVDMLCTPKNPVDDYNAVLSAVNDGDIPMSRIDESVRRILRVKQRLYSDQTPVG